ncbi:MAG: hypothetical protein JSU06_00375 [Actinobacteria bacterium]|nr:hypothetical protein [Actinomycetota bacterium]
MSPLIRPIDPPGPDRPRIESRPYRSVSDLTLLAAVERAGRHTRHPDKGAIARLLGFDFSGPVSRSLEKQLRGLRERGALRSETVYRHRREDWFLTEEGGRRLEQGRGEAEALPESPEHRQWRAARDLAAGQLDEVVGSVLAALGGAESAIRTRATGDLGATDLALLQRLLRWRLDRLGVVLYCLRDWPEPDDDVNDRWARPLVSPVERYAGNLDLLNATEQDELDWLNPQFEMDR